jgi:hypothetical protein
MHFFFWLLFFGIILKFIHVVLYIINLCIIAYNKHSTERSEYIYSSIYLLIYIWVVSSVWLWILLLWIFMYMIFMYMYVICQIPDDYLEWLCYILGVCFTYRRKYQRFKKVVVDFVSLTMCNHYSKHHQILGYSRRYLAKSQFCIQFSWSFLLNFAEHLSLCLVVSITTTLANAF